MQARPIPTPPNIIRLSLAYVISSSMQPYNTKYIIYIYTTWPQTAKYISDTAFNIYIYLTWLNFRVDKISRFRKFFGFSRKLIHAKYLRSGYSRKLIQVKKNLKILPRCLKLVWGDSKSLCFQIFVIFTLFLSFFAYF